MNVLLIAGLGSLALGVLWALFCLAYAAIFRRGYQAAQDEQLQTWEGWTP